MDLLLADGLKPMCPDAKDMVAECELAQVWTQEFDGLRLLINPRSMLLVKVQLSPQRFGQG